tara:strand:- start:803 stop:1450 length:648 start_codon:yes stop_codon:yes gene_type:complete
MDEEISIINSNTRAERIKNFFTSNKKKIIIFLSVILIIIFSIFALEEVKDRKRIKLSNQYFEAIISFGNGDKEKAKKILNKIMIEKDKTYSPLALYFLIDNKLIVSQDLINQNYDNIINNSNLDEEIKFLIIFKKALYNSDFITENELIDILSPIINSKSIWKSHSLYLLGEYFMSKNEEQKAKEFYEIILTLDNSNNKIKALAEKRIQNEFSEK